MRAPAIVAVAILLVLSACSGSSSGSTPPGPSCGDGVIDPGEGCDDGDTGSGDGCSGACTVEPGWSCSGTPSVCTQAPGACGDGVLDPGEECDDGNTGNLDGCDATCRFEQVLRTSQLALAYAPTGACADALGGAVTNTLVQAQLDATVAQSVASGQLGFLFWIRNLGDLTGTSDPGVEVAVFGGRVHPDVTTFTNAQVDGWFEVDGRTVDASRVPRGLLPGAFAGGILTAGPGRAEVPFDLAGSPSLLEVFDARVSFAASAVSAPAVSLTGGPPGHVASEHLAGTLQSFSSATSGELCAAIVARGLSEVPLQSQLQTSCGYPAGRSFLDLLVGGCTYLGMPLSIATQPDAVDPAAPVAGAGGPYRLVFDAAAKQVTGCQDTTGAMVDLGGCLDAAAYSSRFTFTAGRVVVKPACGDGSIGAGEACDDGEVAGGDGCSPTCEVEPGWSCAGAPSVCTTPCGASCDDGVGCTVDSCNGATLACEHAAVAGACDDQNPCTSDACDPAVGCVNQAVLDGTACDAGGAGTCQSGVCVRP